jgi:3-hydroxyacyl-CoA dehydrogenase/enoyl-CoA hydratase/3-hydroxybutyryl-CoA epimerase
VQPRDALAAGLVDEVVAPDALIPAAKAWIRANPDAHIQPWDAKGFAYPGGGAEDARVLAVAKAAATTLQQKTRGLMPAPEKILDIAVKSMAMPFDAALTLETRGFMALMTTPEAKAAVTTFFLGMQAIRSGKFRPDGPRWQAETSAVIGAGMMGAGIGHAHARRGLATLLKDIGIDNAEAGKAHAAALCDTAIRRGRMDGAGRAGLLDLITPTTDNAAPGSIDIVIEAVFEDIDLKERVIAETWPMLADGGIYGTSTSTLPISILAEACPDPSRFVGLHFFSPVDRMKVVEIVLGEKTSTDTVRRAYDYVEQIGYLPIVVNDNRGFFTSRVFATYLDEGCQLLIDGMAPAEIERAAWLAGMPVGPLAVFDEVSLILGQKARRTHAALDARLGVDSSFGAQNTATVRVTDAMIAMGRGGRKYGGGFYDYAEDGTKTLWPGLARFAGGGGAGVDEARERLLYRQAIETLRCLDEGVLRSEVEANLGGILAIGFPRHTGGAIQFIRGIGIERFAARAQELAARHGERFAVTDSAFERLRGAAG